MEKKMPNKYDMPLWIAIDELMKNKQYESVEKVVQSAITTYAPYNFKESESENIKSE